MYSDAAKGRFRGQKSLKSFQIYVDYLHNNEAKIVFFYSIWIQNSHS